MDEHFSDRHGHSAFDAPLVIREDAPDEIRLAVIHFAAEAGLTPIAARSILLRLLALPPEPQNWSGPSFVLEEVQRHLMRARWFEVYDAAEAFWHHIAQKDIGAANDYASHLNRLFMRLGVGWTLTDGRLEARGSESFELQVGRAKRELGAHGLTVAGQEVHEALLDLSRRPTPDLTGAIQHAVAGLECVARGITGSPNLTLGALLKAHPTLFPPPLDSAFEKIWGFASERARHLREGGAPDREEAELVVSLTAAAITYLLQKLPSANA
jgi:hypothetical protein